MESASHEPTISEKANYRPADNVKSDSFGIYVHIPFCSKHCPYCDFNVHIAPAQSPLVQNTVDAICADIERAAQSVTDGRATPDAQSRSSRRRPVQVDSIFFGGGTPTYLSGAQLARILRTILSNFDVDADVEISSEANPGSVDAGNFADMRIAGFNRLSIGVQALDNALLRVIGREHTAEEAEQAFSVARAAGFDNINMDLMFGLPGQDLNNWNASLDRILSLGSQHLSLYALTLEPGTRFERLHKGGKLKLPDEEIELEMYESCIARLASAGLEHYEVSNFAQPGYRSQHNQLYWRNDAYLGVGPGAVSYINGRRWKRERVPARYVDRVNHELDLAIESEELESDGVLGETMMLGLRMREGLPLERIRKRFGIDPLIRFARQVELLQRQGILTVSETSMTLTHRGMLFANDILCEFLP